MRYEAQYIPGPRDDRDRGEFRITDKRTDSRVATCFLQENAKLVTDALNAMHAVEPKATDVTTEIRDECRRRLSLDARRHGEAVGLAQWILAKVGAAAEPRGSISGAADEPKACTQPGCTVLCRHAHDAEGPWVLPAVPPPTLRFPRATGADASAGGWTLDQHMLTAIYKETRTDEYAPSEEGIEDVLLAYEKLYGAAEPPPDALLLEVRTWLHGRMPCPAGPCCDELRAMIAKLDERLGLTKRNAP